MHFRVKTMGHRDAEYDQCGFGVECISHGARLPLLIFTSKDFKQETGCGAPVVASLIIRLYMEKEAVQAALRYNPDRIRMGTLRRP
jgi:hypothetical protein